MEVVEFWLELGRCVLLDTTNDKRMKEGRGQVCYLVVDVVLVGSVVGVVDTWAEVVGGRMVVVVGSKRVVVVDMRGAVVDR